jgi:c-di-GMP-binding flagellar brake protein YcgR
MPQVQDTEQSTLNVGRTLGKSAARIADESQRVERLPGIHLELELGSTLAIKLPPGEKKFDGRLVGMEPFSYLIVQARLPQDAVARLSSNPNLVAQHLASGAVYGFRSTVVNRVTTPAPLLFLAFPDSVERLALRRNERVSVSIHGNLHGHYGDHEVMLTDLAPSGCQITAAIDLRSRLREAKTGEDLVLSCDLGRGNTLMTPVRLRRRDEAKGLLTLGCQFVELTEETRSVIEAYVSNVQRFTRN